MIGKRDSTETAKLTAASFDHSSKLTSKDVHNAKRDIGVAGERGLPHVQMRH